MSIFCEKTIKKLFVSIVSIRREACDNYRPNHCTNCLNCPNFEKKELEMLGRNDAPDPHFQELFYQVRETNWKSYWNVVGDYFDKQREKRIDGVGEKKCRVA